MKNYTRKKEISVSQSTKKVLCKCPKIWNALPFNIKTAKNLKTFKTLIKKMEWRIMQLFNIQPIVACFYNFKNVYMHIKI